MPASRDLRETYDAAAPEYQRLIRGLDGEAPVDRAMIAAFAEHVAAGGDRRVLDAGCGTGRLVPVLAGGGLEPVGVDASAGMVARARAEHPETAFVVADLATLPFPDRTFAGVLAWYSLIHTPPDQLRGTLAELGRVLAPGGHLLAGFQVGQGIRQATGSYLGGRSVTAHLFTPEQVAAHLTDLRLHVLATCTRAPDGQRHPQGFVLARRPASPAS